MRSRRSPLHGTTSAEGILRVPNPHHRERIDSVERLIVHAIAEWVVDEDGTPWHCTDYLRRVELSVHAFCLPDGRLVEAVPVERLAFHAKDWNEGSVGIEIVVAGAHDLDSLLARMGDFEAPPYTAAQYLAAGRWLRLQADRFDLRFADVFGHGELDPGRKEDPGRAFDFRALRNAFEERAEPSGD